jgi:hypothetical protein
LLVTFIIFGTINEVSVTSTTGDVLLIITSLLSIIEVVTVSLTTSMTLSGRFTLSIILVTILVILVFGGFFLVVVIIFFLITVFFLLAGAGANTNFFWI